MADYLIPKVTGISWDDRVQSVGSVFKTHGVEEVQPPWVTDATLYDIYQPRASAPKGLFKQYLKEAEYELAQRENRPEISFMAGAEMLNKMNYFIIP